MRKPCLLFVFLLLSPALGWGLTLSQIRTEIRRALRDDPSDTARRRYGDSVLLDFINQSQREIVSQTWLAERTSSYVLSPLTTYYALPSDTLAIKQIYFTNASGQTAELQEVSQVGLYDNNPNWDRSQGTPSEYWVSQATNPQNQQTAPLRIAYMPIATRTSTGTVTLWIYYQPPDLSADGDVPFDNRRHLYPYHLALAYHVVTRIKLIEGKLEEALAYQALFNSFIGLTQNRLGQAPNYNPGMNIPSTNRR